MKVPALVLQLDNAPLISFMRRFSRDLVDAKKRKGLKLPADLVRVAEEVSPGRDQLLIRAYPSDAFLRFAAEVLDGEKATARRPRRRRGRR